MKMNGEPEMTCVTRWNESMPQYHVGAHQRVQRCAESFLSGRIRDGRIFRRGGHPRLYRPGKAAVYDSLAYLFERTSLRYRKTEVLHVPVL